MKYLYLILRILLGLIFVLLGANGFHDFMHMAAHMPPRGTPVGDWEAIMYTSGWLRAINIVELIGGLALLIGAVPLGLCLLCPVLVNILFFHLCMPNAGGGQIIPGLVLSLVAAILIYGYRASFAGILTLKSAPTL